MQRLVRKQVIMSKHFSCFNRSGNACLATIANLSFSTMSEALCPCCPVTDPDQKIIFQENLVLFMQNERAQGALKHSGVIIPIQHRETVFDLSEQEIVATFRLLSIVRHWMDENFSPDGYNVGWNCGKVGGQEVLHAHMHVIPRFRQEPLAGAGIRTLLKSDANKW